MEGDDRRLAREAAERRRRIYVRAGQAVDYAFFVIYGLLAIRFMLTLIGASETAGFVRFLHAVTFPLYGPFSGIIAPGTVSGLVIDFSALIALLVYVLIHIAVLGLLRVLYGAPPVKVG